MEWVETTGKTVEEAKERALDRLGVDDADAEFEVLQEPRTGLFGRVRTEARVRARVRPTTPPAKEDRRDRRRRRRGGSNSEAAAQGTPSSNGASDARGGAASSGGQPSGRESSSGGSSAGGSPSEGGRRRGHRSGQAARGSDAAQPGAGSSGTAAKSAQVEPGRSRKQGTRQRERAAAVDGASAYAGPDEGEDAGMEIALEEQGRVAQAFLTGMVEEMGLQAAVAVQERDEETVEVVLSGDDLGVLIGPRGATLYAIQDLTRTVVQRRTRADNGRVLVDVGGYRQKRQEALVRFVQQVAAEVKETGGRKALEPMNAADRKVVHDAVNEIDGVTTVSEGEDSSRHVVVLPE